MNPEDKKTSQEQSSKSKKKFNLFKLNYKNNPLNLFTAFIITFVIYFIVFCVFFLNFKDIRAAFIEDKSIILREAVLQPQTNTPADEIFHADPLLTTSRDSDALVEIRKNINYLTFSTLFKESETGEMQKDIVKDYEFKEGKELVLKIYDDILWHDGQKLTTDDIVFTLNQIQAIGGDNLFYGAVNGGEISYSASSSFDLTIKLENKDGPKPNSAYLHELVFPILPKHLLEKYSQADMRSLSTTKFGEHPIGSGKLVYSKNRNTELELAKNNKYYGKKINFDIYRLRLYQNYEDINKDYVLRNIDIFSRKDVAGLDEFHESVKDFTKNYSTVLKNRRLVLYFNLNSSKSSTPFSSSFTLRSNLQKVIDRSKLLESISRYGREIYGPIDESSWAFWEGMKNAQKQDIAAFKTAVEGLGYTMKDGYYEKDGIVLGFTLSFLEGDVRLKLAQTLESQLKDVGVKVTLNPIGELQEDSIAFDLYNSSPINEYNTLINNRSFEVLLTAVDQYQDPDRYSEWHSTKASPPGINLSGFSSIRSDFALSQGRVEYDQGTRKDYYYRFQNDFLQEVPAIYLLNPTMITYYSPKIHNIESAIINDVQYKYQNISEWEVR